VQRRLYRFEIMRGLSNAIYQAVDTVDQSTVFIYEWTPEQSEREKLLKKLQSVIMRPGVETFSAGASLYLAASSKQDAEKALAELSAHGLFTGVWHGASLPTTHRVEAPPPPPPPPRKK
jgi:hypothetical protein